MSLLYSIIVLSDEKKPDFAILISIFFANIYLREMDEFFAERNVLYARYSDDIIIFGGRDETEESIRTYRGFLEKYGLVSNPSKEQRFAPASVPYVCPDMPR